MSRRGLNKCELLHITGDLFASATGRG